MAAEVMMKYVNAKSQLLCPQHSVSDSCAWHRLCTTWLQEAEGASSRIFLNHSLCIPYRFKEPVCKEPIRNKVSQNYISAPYRLLIGSLLYCVPYVPSNLSGKERPDFAQDCLISSCAADSLRVP
jgi:hypothetical protein